MIESAKLDRLLTQVNCRIASIARLREARAISERKAEQVVKQAVELRAELMRQIEGQNVAFDAQDPTWPQLVSMAPEGTQTDFDLGYRAALTSKLSVGANLYYQDEADNDPDEWNAGGLGRVRLLLQGPDRS